MRAAICVVVGLAAGMLPSCGGGDKGSQGAFRLLQFLENGQNGIPRNRSLTFVFSAPVATAQDFFERVRVQNVQSGPGGSGFSKAIGVYLVSGERLEFVPRLPEQSDRSDAGFRANANYSVFVKAGPDALTSETGDTITRQQEFLFTTSEFFEDPVPAEPPRALGLVARDVTSQQTVALDRLDPRPSALASMDNATLIAAGLVIEPGAGGGPDFSTPWEFELGVSEPLDPATVVEDNVEMFEIFSDATTSGETAAPAAPANATPPYFGTAVSFQVPINVTPVQQLLPDGTVRLLIRVRPIFALVDNTRYRLRFSGNILGIDFRKSFIGENGLTGDGQTVLPGETQPEEEPGGLGYVTEFIVRDRPAIVSSRTVDYDPLLDGIDPEKGQTQPDEEKWNSALYNPTSAPGTAVGFLSAFGDGRDGNLAVPGGSTVVIDTGDTPNAGIGNPFQALDLNPNDDYLNNPLPGALKTWDSPEPFEMRLASLTVSSSSTLRVIGRNPIVFRVSGVTQISGTIDASGGDGQHGGSGFANGGVAGAGGFPGGSTVTGSNACTYCPSCVDFSTYLQSCSPANATWPHTLNGEGPGRGYAGGAVYVYDYQDDLPIRGGTGGGGASHATAGSAGEDRMDAGGAPGTTGSNCGGSCPVRTAGIIGVRGRSGPTYGDREIELVTFGGSGGGGGGSVSVWAGPKAQAGGAGGGGGGSIAIVCAGPIIATGGVVDASGGNGGNGAIAVQSAPNNWRSTSGAGGGGAGGSITLISGDAMTVAGGLLDASGGAGGLRSNANTSLTCAACNAGGNGGKGFIFLMDADGTIGGLIPGAPGQYDTYANGVLTISTFSASRFSSISAITELFHVLAANPEYQPLLPTDVLAVLAPGQRVRVFASSARADILKPLLPDLLTEIAALQIALASHTGGSINVVTSPVGGLNPAGMPARDAFLRIDARFEYDNGVQAALGPFAAIDRVTVRYRFNG